MASNYSQLHLATISDANFEVIYCCKTVKDVPKGRTGAAPKKNRQINYHLNICSLTNTLKDFKNAKMKFIKFTNFLCINFIEICQQ